MNDEHVVPGQTVTRLSDPKALRAYAHPVRMKLIVALRTRGALTATQAGRLLGESSGTCSFHLRQLAKYGLVEETGGGTGREKPWRATTTSTSWDELPETPEASAAASLLNETVAQWYFAELMRWLEVRSGEDEKWQRAAFFGDRFLWVTAGRARPGRAGAARGDRQVLRAPGQARAAADGGTARDLPAPRVPQHDPARHGTAR